MNEQITYDGQIEYIRYHNEDNGYTVFDLVVQNEDDEICCVGYMPGLTEGESVKVAGSFVVHPIYGRQLSVESYEKKIPTTEKGIEKYLASGVIKGIGPKLASRIVERFGVNTFMVIEEYPEKLAGIRNINMEKAMKISAEFHEQAELRRALLYLQDFGISPNYALKIYKKYKENTLETVKNNPYTLADDITGIGFKTADSIAFKAGIEKDSEYRIRAGIKCCLLEASSDGQVYLPKNILINNAGELLGVPPELVENQLEVMHIGRDIRIEKIDDRILVFLYGFYRAEDYVAKKLSSLAMNTLTGGLKADGLIEMAVGRLEKEKQIELAEKQKTAVEESLSSGVLIITGGPGTGKTTTINSIIHVLKYAGLSIALAAPTGRAAKRLSEATGMEAKTIHRMLGMGYSVEDDKQAYFNKNEDDPIEADAVIIDESSMVDIYLMHGLLKAIAPESKLILVGDVDQLPSVGPGNVLKDIIASGAFKVVRLTEIFRQAEESAIVMNAHRINRGEYPKLNDKEKDFFFIKRQDTELLIETLVELVTKRLPGYLNCDVFQDIQVLTPMRKSELGARNLNMVLQKALNPPAPHKKEKELARGSFRIGDKVMQIKNNYNTTWTLIDQAYKKIGEGTGVFNGDCGIIQDIDEDDEKLTVLFDDNRIVEYDFSQLDELELAYAVTIHKSQGSEYKAVVIPMLSGPPMLMTRNLLYTAVTRAKELAVLAGIPATLYRMVDNNREVNRYTALGYRIKKVVQSTELLQST